MQERTRILLLALLAACAEVKEPPPTEFEARCNRILRDILPDVHAVLGEGIGRQVRVRESGASPTLFDPFTSVTPEEPGVIVVFPESLEKSWEWRKIEDRQEQDRELARVLLRDAVGAYQHMNHPWMHAGRRDPLVVVSTMSSIVPDGHVAYVEQEVARRRGWPELTRRDPRQIAKTAERLCTERCIAILESKLPDPGTDGRDFWRALVDRLGHAGALSFMRDRPDLSAGEVWGLGPLDAGEREIRDRLVRLASGGWEEALAYRVRADHLSAMVRGSELPAAARDGWCLDAANSDGAYDRLSACAFRVGDARRVLDIAQRAMDGLTGSDDLAALASERSEDTLRLEFLTPNSGLCADAELWFARGEWLVVVYGERLYGGFEWCEAWAERVLAAVRGAARSPASNGGPVDRWQAVRARLRELSEGEWLQELRPLLDDPSIPVRALAWAHVPWFEVGTEDREALLRTWRKQKDRRVRRAIAGPGTPPLKEAFGGDGEARAVVESLLHDPDPFVRHVLWYAIWEWDFRDHWHWFWRFALTDPNPGLRAAFLGALQLDERGWSSPLESWNDPVPGRGTVENAVRELLGHSRGGPEALRLLIYAGSQDERLWPLLLQEIREQDDVAGERVDHATLLARCPVPGGDRRAALQALAEDENEPDSLRLTAEMALDE